MNKRERTAKPRLREPVSGLIHLSSAVLAGMGGILLVVMGWREPLRTVSLAVYAISLVTLFTASAVYHLINTSPQNIQRLRKFDHAAIYILIAGTYTPICMNIFEGFWRWGFLGIIWGIGITGVIVKLFVINAPRWVTAGVYVVMGWLAVFAIKEMLRTIPAASLLWLLAGGLLYTVGAIIYITKKFDFKPGIFGFHEVWHVFVSLAAFCHFFLILKLVAIG
jgi:hemolysin III